MKDQDQSPRAPDPTRGDSLEHLRALRKAAPPHFARRVMAALPEKTPAPLPMGLARFWPGAGQWWLPALAGAAAVLILTQRLAPPAPPPAVERVVVHFELHAPSAAQVELLGDFTDWKTGSIHLAGPDASGHWTADVGLPAGRHEYAFLVDGKQWLTDPRAEVRRADGFGRENSVLEL